jgi:hypothetical protein
MTLAHDQTRADCTTNGNAWYFDDAANPCSAGCDTAQTDPKATVSVVYPCN